MTVDHFTKTPLVDRYERANRVTSRLLHLGPSRWSRPARPEPDTDSDAVVPADAHSDVNLKIPVIERQFSPASAPPWPLNVEQMYLMRSVSGLKGEVPFAEWMGALVGVTERAVALTLVIWAPRYLVVFVGGWVLLKFAIGWQRTPLNNRVARGSLLALIANVLSFAIAIVLGVMFLNPDALKVWATAN